MDITKIYYSREAEKSKILWTFKKKSNILWTSEKVEYHSAQARLLHHSRELVSGKRRRAWACSFPCLYILNESVQRIS